MTQRQNCVISISSTSVLCKYFTQTKPLITRLIKIQKGQDTYYCLLETDKSPPKKEKSGKKIGTNLIFNLASVSFIIVLK